MRNNTIFHKCIRHIKWLLESIKGYYDIKKIINNTSYVFISHNGDSAGGAPVVLFELMRTLKKEGLILLCEKPGGILQQCNIEGIPAFSTYLLQNKYLKLINKSNVKAVIINTMAAYKAICFFEKNNSHKQLIWWIHEESRLIKKYSCFVPKTIKKNLQIECVSKSVENDLIYLCPQCIGHTDILFYGCTDLYDPDRKHESAQDVFKISVIGRVCDRKNQLQIVEAYYRLPDNLRKHIYVDFVTASYDQDYKDKMNKLIKNSDHFAFIGPIKRKDMPKIYYQSNLIISSSLDDPLPVVVTEALMLKRPVITSSRTGQYELIKNGINGFSYDVHSIDQLCELIQKIYQTSDMREILENERKTYLKYFTPEVVSGKFMELLQKVE